jgi:hypothetical protein
VGNQWPLLSSGGEGASWHRPGMEQPRVSQGPPSAPPSSPSMCPPVLPFGEQALKNSDAQDIQKDKTVVSLPHGPPIPIPVAFSKTASEATSRLVTDGMCHAANDLSGSDMPMEGTDDPVGLTPTPTMCPTPTHQPSRVQVARNL